MKARLRVEQGNVTYWEEFLLPYIYILDRAVEAAGYELDYDAEKEEYVLRLPAGRGKVVKVFEQLLSALNLWAATA
ncbi:MAG: hypothetical protein JRD89_00405 [Deltaproteobacteria bacterium]|nr:hypothetical protein [Deltaproteobacteria bacterium]